jgi:hypothetical protein
MRIMNGSSSVGAKRLAWGLTSRYGRLRNSTMYGYAKNPMDEPSARANAQRMMRERSSARCSQMVILPPSRASGCAWSVMVMIS